MTLEIGGTRNDLFKKLEVRGFQVPSSLMKWFRRP